MKKELETFGDKIVFLPDATRATLRGLTTRQIKEVKTEAMVVNTLHLMTSPGADDVKKLGGVHAMMNWDGLLLSDSGGFQVFSLLHKGKWKGGLDGNGATFYSPKSGDKYRLTPEIAIDIQVKLGTDILVILDDCRKSESTRSEAEESVYRTLKWAEKTMLHIEKNYPDLQENKLLSCVVQGANFHDLREYCAKELSNFGFDGFNFGGYVLDEHGNFVVDQLTTVMQNTPKEAFKYAMGVGKPEDIFEAVKIGYTVFDTVLPTRNARHGTLYTSEGEIRIRNAKYTYDKTQLDPNCDCELCSTYDRAYLRHLIRNNEMTGMVLATIHNLRFYNRLVEYLNSIELADIKNKSYTEILGEF